MSYPMVSDFMLNKHSDRLNLAQQWLKSLNYQCDLEPLVGDASFRSYWRLTVKNQSVSTTGYLLMDCPPDKESLATFIKVRHIFAENLTWRVPVILEQNIPLGFALIEDFGEHALNRVYINETEIQTNPNKCLIHPSIELSLDALISLQKLGVNAKLQPYDPSKLQAEMDLFIPWFVENFCSYTLNGSEQTALENCYRKLIANILEQPQVMVHRDYHCRNLFLLRNQGSPMIGVIDFQDAVNGAVTYDAVSILKDCYWRLSHEQRLSLLQNYWKKSQIHIPQIPNWENFQRDFNWMGIQRHFKIAGIFCRLGIRDNKPDYLANLPLTLDYLSEALSLYSEFSAIGRLITKLSDVAKEKRKGLQA